MLFATHLQFNYPYLNFGIVSSNNINEILSHTFNLDVNSRRNSRTTVSISMQNNKKKIRKSEGAESVAKNFARTFAILLVIYAVSCSEKSDKQIDECVIVEFASYSIKEFRGLLILEA